MHLPQWPWRGREAGLRLRIAGAQFRRIDAEQCLPLSDIGALFIDPLLDDPGDACADFRDPDRLDASGQFENVVEIGFADRDRPDRDGLALWRRIG
ncbi:hypothetical protein [Qipengyuania profunda]|uniref:hypothetical protein n=1 Tax=Qipengyuania profunda TaxID=3113984 RepID=UPI003B5877D2